jgi:hypothetical protein
MQNGTAKRLRNLEEFVWLLDESDTLRLGEQPKADSRFMALYSLVHDLAEHQGISSSEFLWHYDIRTAYFYDYYLRRVAKSFPQLAIEIDERPLNMARPGDSYPPLFPSSEQD